MFILSDPLCYQVRKQRPRKAIARSRLRVGRVSKDLRLVGMCRVLLASVKENHLPIPANVGLQAKKSINLPTQKRQELDRNTQDLDRNTQDLDRNTQELDRNTQELDRNTQDLDRNTLARSMQARNTPASSTLFHLGVLHLIQVILMTLAGLLPTGHPKFLLLAHPSLTSRQVPL
jgi:hypothetical protein